MARAKRRNFFMMEIMFLIFLMPFVIHEITLDLKFSLERFFSRIMKSAMDDSAVGFGNTETDIGFLFKQYRLQFITAQAVRI